MARPPDTTRQVHDQLIELEERLGLWDLEAYGQRYWHQIRHAVYIDVLQSLGLMGQPQRSWRDRPLSSWVKSIRPRHWGPALRRSQWFDLKPADVLVLSHPRLVPLGDGWICPYTHPLLDTLPQSHQVVEDVWQGTHSFPQRQRGLKYLELNLLLCQIAFLARHGVTGGRLNAAERDGVGDWCVALTRALGGGPSQGRALALTRAAVRELMSFDTLYPWLLDRVRPKLVVNVVHYSYRCLALTRIARERAIPVAELQHGTLGETHFAYNFATGRRPESFPDYFLTFGDWWRDGTPGLPLPAERMPAVGFAWLEAHRTGARRLERARRQGRKPVVLFLSQATIGEELSRMAVDLARLTSGQRHIRFKLHPGELLGWQERYPWLGSAPIEVIDRPTNLYEELAGADAVVGVYSTAMFESVAFGVPLMLMRLPGHERMESFIELGAGVFCDDVEQLARALAAAVPPPESVRELLWKPGAVEGFHRFVGELVR
ncbi:MAG: hypothetical protein JRI68_03650 [Deltaproteobacteria bacterium]|nr:hypothetical protein [Deltaproteobacteria bacterium]